MQWKYIIANTDEDVEAMGMQGWELVSVVSHNDRKKLYFKKPVQSLSERITSEQREAVLKNLRTEETE